MPGRGAEALYSLASLAFTGGLPPSVSSWFLGGRLIALAKDGDVPTGLASQRKLRPIAIGSVLARAVSMVAAHQFRLRFAAYLQPPPPGSHLPTRQPDGSPWPAQVGVACGSGLEFVAHSVRAILDEHPDWVDCALDCTNAFNSIHRRAFMSVVAERFPGLWDWVSALYGAPAELYVRRAGSDAPAVVLSRCGTRQGDPLGAQLFALGLHPVLLAISSLLGDRGVVVAYADDVHILAPPAVLASILPQIAGSTPPAVPPHPAPPLPDPRFLSVGLSLAPGKATFYGPSLAQPGTRAATSAALWPAVRALADPSVPLDTSMARMLRGDGSAVAEGHPVLGVPIGTDTYAAAFVERYAARAERLIGILDHLLLCDDRAHCAAGARAYAPDERDLLLRFCVATRLRHFLRTIPPGVASDIFRRFDDAVHCARMRPLGPVVPTDIHHFALVPLCPGALVDMVSSLIGLRRLPSHLGMMLAGTARGALFGTTCGRGSHRWQGGSLPSLGRWVGLPTSGLLLLLLIASLMRVRVSPSCLAMLSSSLLTPASLRSTAASPTAASPPPLSRLASLPPTLMMARARIARTCFTPLTRSTLLAIHTPRGPPRLW